MVDDQRATEWQFKEGLTEENVPKLFWRAMAKLHDIYFGNAEETESGEKAEGKGKAAESEGGKTEAAEGKEVESQGERLEESEENVEEEQKPIEERVKAAIAPIKDYAELTPSILVSAFERGTYVNFVDVSPSDVLYLAFKLYYTLGCMSCIGEIVEELQENFSLSLAFEHFLDELSEDEQVKFVNRLVKSHPSELMELFAMMSRKSLGKFVHILYNLARNEIGTVQYRALELLQRFMDREDVKELYFMFADDWDPQVRFISLSAIEDLPPSPRVKKLVDRLLREEDEPANLEILQRIKRRLKEAEEEARGRNEEAAVDERASNEAQAEDVLAEAMEKESREASRGEKVEKKKEGQGSKRKAQQETTERTKKVKKKGKKEKDNNMKTKDIKEEVDDVLGGLMDEDMGEG